MYTVCRSRYCGVIVADKAVRLLSLRVCGPTINFTTRARPLIYLNATGTLRGGVAAAGPNAVSFRGPRTERSRARPRRVSALA